MIRIRTGIVIYLVVVMFVGQFIMLPPSKINAVVVNEPKADWIFETTAILFSAPTIYDINGDGMGEIIVASEDDHLYCIGPDGKMIWSVPLLYNEFELAAILSSPAVVDIDDDNAPEVIVGSDDGLACIDHNGRVEWIYTGSATRYVSSPAIADIDKDGVLDIIAGSVGDYMVKRFTPQGELVWKYATGYGDFDAAVLSSPTIFDLDGDGIMEILIATHNSVVLTLNTYGELVWHFKTGHVNVATPSVGDVDKDNIWDIISGSDDHSFYSVNTRGEMRWSFETLGPVVSSPAIGDIDGDGAEECIIGSDDGRVYCLGPEGNIEWTYKTGGQVRSSPAIADLNSDGYLEVIVGSNDGMVYTISHDGNLIWSYSTGGAIKYASPTVGDIDNDGYMEIIIGSSDGNLYCIQNPEKTENIGAIEWSMFKHDITHTGRYSGPVYFTPLTSELVISNIEYSNTVIAGAGHQINVEIENIGSDDVGDVEIVVIDTSDNKILATTTVESIAQGESKWVTLTWYANVDPGEYNLKVVVDLKNIFHEVNEDNNVKDINVKVQSPDNTGQISAPTTASTTNGLMIYAILFAILTAVVIGIIMARRRK